MPEQTQIPVVKENHRSYTMGTVVGIGDLPASLF